MNSLLNPFRRATQIFGIFITNMYVSVVYQNEIYKGMFKSVCVPFLYCHTCPTAGFACPVGVLQHYAAIHHFPFFLIGHLMIIGLLIGRLVCGWACPFGLMQELMYKIKSPKIRKIPKAFSIFPYFTLIVLAIILPYMTTEHWFSKFCPIGSIVAGIPWVAWNPINPSTGNLTIEPGTVGWLYYTKIVLMLVIVSLFIFIKRPFCRFMCPLGLFWSFFNKVSVMKLEIEPGCTHCNACQTKCPEDIKVFEDPNAGDCVRCLDCTDCEHIRVVCALPLDTEKLGKRLRATKTTLWEKGKQLIKKSGM